MSHQTAETGTRWTPGEWQMLGGRIAAPCHEHPNCEKTIAWLGPTGTLQCSNGQYQHANATLIAAAPDLYAALTDSLETIIWMSGSADFSPGGQAHEGWKVARAKLDTAFAALKKARGEA